MACQIIKRKGKLTAGLLLTIANKMLWLAAHSEEAEGERDREGGTEI